MNTYLVNKDTTGARVTETKEGRGVQYRDLNEGDFVIGRHLYNNLGNQTSFKDKDGFVFRYGQLFTLVSNKPEKKSSFTPDISGVGKFHLIGHSVGVAGGIYYSFLKKTGFWKGLGITIVVGIAGGALGMAVDALVNNKKEA